MRLAPPLVIARAELEWALEQFTLVVREIERDVGIAIQVLPGREQSADLRAHG